MRLAAAATLAAASLLASPVTAQNLVTNGGFEDVVDNYNGWGLNGSFYTTSFSIAPGEYSLYYVEQDVEGSLYQSINTVPGGSYLFSFWLMTGLLSPLSEATNAFVATWGSDQVMSLSNTALSHNFVYFSFMVQATAPTTTIAFSFLSNNPKNIPDWPWWGMDEVSVVALESDVVPEPATMTLLATGLAGMAAARRRKRNAS